MRTIDCAGSSNIEAIAYDPDVQELHVTFKGGAIYCYEGVGPKKAEELEQAHSKGQYLNANIKPSHQVVKL